MYIHFAESGCFDMYLLIIVTNTTILTCYQEPRPLHRPLEQRKVNDRLVIPLALTIETLYLIYFA